MKKVIKLTESDLVNIIKRVIVEQTNEKIFRFNNAIGSPSYRITTTTQVSNGITKIQFVKIYQDGKEEKMLYTGFLKNNQPREVYKDENLKVKFGVANIDLVTNNTPPNDTPSNNTTSNRTASEGFKLLIRAIKESDVFVIKEIKGDKIDVVFQDYNKSRETGVSGFILVVSEQGNKKVVKQVINYMTINDGGRKYKSSRNYPINSSNIFDYQGNENKVLTSMKNGLKMLENEIFKIFKRSNESNENSKEDRYWDENGEFKFPLRSDKA